MPRRKPKLKTGPKLRGGATEWVRFELRLTEPERSRWQRRRLTWTRGRSRSRRAALTFTDSYSNLEDAVETARAAGVLK